MNRIFFAMLLTAFGLGAAELDIPLEIDLAIKKSDVAAVKKLLGQLHEKHLVLGDEILILEWMHQRAQEQASSCNVGSGYVGALVGAGVVATLYGSYRFLTAWGWAKKEIMSGRKKKRLRVVRPKVESVEAMIRHKTFLTRLVFGLVAGAGSIMLGKGLKSWQETTHLARAQEIVAFIEGFLNDLKSKSSYIDDYKNVR